MTAEVHPLFPPAEEDPVVATRERRPWCSHRQVQLDTEARRVYCRACTREVDPFEALLSFAREYERYVHQLAEVQRNLRLAEASLAGLLREERNAKARARRRGVR